jgi:fructose-bisphosphate aldolase class II
MTLATLKDVLQPALANGYAVAGVVCLGWEDTRAYVEAAVEEQLPIILQAGPGCRAHTPLPVLASMFRYLAEQADVPVVVHLDHGYEVDEIRRALDCGFTSVMYDGSRKSLNQNIEETAEIAAIAHAVGASCEGEIGFVGYDEGESSAFTSPEDAAKFATQSGVDAMAISVGNVHLQKTGNGNINVEQLKAIELVTNIPLVIHGGSGVPVQQRAFLATTSNICKYNIGTELRMEFGNALRLAVNKDLQRFDRNAILKEIHEPLKMLTQNVIRNIGNAGVVK